MTLVAFGNETLGYGAETVLTGVSFALTPGDRVVLLGRSGAGKSTLLSACYDRLITAGHRVALAPQDHALVPQLCVLRNVLMGRLDDHSALYNLRSLIRPRQADRHDIDQTLQMIDLGNQIDQRVDSLSGGQKQRTALARALYRGGAVLIADEPVSAVDETQADALLSLMADRFQTSVLALHDVGQARRFATRLVGLAAGRITFDAAPSEVTDEMIGTLYAQ